MALDKVVKDIIESAKREADSLVQDAERQRDQILGEADQSISQMRERHEKDLEEARKRLRRQEISSAELESKKIVLNKKKEILDRTFEEALEELSSMPPKEKSRIYRKSIEASKDVVPNPKVYCPKGEAEIVSEMEGVKEVEEADIESGLLLESGDGSIRVDYRFRTLLEGIWEQELKNVSNILFG
ncbi:MAG: V-type ATPase subunit subunit G family protein [Methanomassiliicoccales archaeon]